MFIEVYLIQLKCKNLDINWAFLKVLTFAACPGPSTHYSLLEEKFVKSSRKQVITFICVLCSLKYVY